MNLSEIGEFDFINRFVKNLSGPLPKGVLGIGDDCAIIPWHKENSLLITTDSLIEDVHFLRSAISPHNLGYKSLAVNLSDIAAMGGQPCYAFISLALNKNTPLEWFDGFFSGFKSLAEQWGVKLLGGDTTKSLDRMAINITVVGQVQTRRIKLRAAAQPGDVICVTGLLGDSFGGLKLILEHGVSEDADFKYLINKHHQPKSHMAEGLFLSEFKSVHAMIDVSDGLNSDLKRIMESSHCGAEIQLEDIPVSTSLQNASQKLNWDAKEMAAIGGEDYCLLVTVDPIKFPMIAKAFKKKFQTSLYNIGKITTNKDSLTYFKNNRSTKLKQNEWTHFK